MMATLSMSTRALRTPMELLEDIVMRMIPIAVPEDTAMEIPTGNQADIPELA